MSVWRRNWRAIALLLAGRPDPLLTQAQQATAQNEARLDAAAQVVRDVLQKVGQR